MLCNGAKLMLFAVVAFQICSSVEAQFEDSRCKCVCPANPGSDKNFNAKVVTIPSIECHCENVMNKSELECLRCECNFEVRNTLIIEIVVMFLIVFILVLLVYLVALLIMDPGMLKKSRSDHNRLPQDSFGSSSSTPMPSNYIRRRLSRVECAQKRWQGTVKQQRQNVFEEHTLLS